MFLDGLRRQCTSWTFYLTLHLWVCITGVSGELCEYKRSVYNIFTNTYDKDRFTKECQWGCCYHHNSPCCSVPMTLIIGCILGGLGVFSLLVLSIFCGMYCKRKSSAEGRRSSARLRRQNERSAGSAEQVNHDTVYFSSSSSSAVVQNEVTNEAPPSYEDVMRGLHIQGGPQTNAAFKDDEGLA